MTGEHLGNIPEVLEKVKFEYFPLGEVFSKGLEKEDKKERILKKFGIIRDANKKQLHTIKDENLKLMKRIEANKPKLKSLRYKINNEDKEQLKYFENPVKLGLSINYTKLYYQSGNRYKDAFYLNKFESMTDFYRRLKNGLITFEEAKSGLMRFNGLLDTLSNAAARKYILKEKWLWSELLLEGL